MTDERTIYYGDTPVPWEWPRLMRQAPKAKFVMTDVKAESWRSPRRASTHEHITH